MAERRMFTKKVTDDDNFMQLSASAQALYLHLSMSADDDGFCNQVSISMFKAHASTNDLQSLLEKRYIYQFENGVIVIKHWRMANALRKDRYTPTAFQEELKQLGLKDNGSYTLVAKRLPDGCQTVAACLPQDSIGEFSLVEDNNFICGKPQIRKFGEYKNVIFSEEELKKLQKEFPNDWQKRIEILSEYMASTGKKYKNHLATIRRWAKRDQEAKQSQQQKTDHSYDLDEIRKLKNRI